MSGSTEKEKCSVDESQKSDDGIEKESQKLSEIYTEGETHDCSDERNNFKIANHVVIVAHAIEGVQKNIDQKMIQTIRYDNEGMTSDSPSVNINENSTVESLQEKNYYSRPLPVKIELEDLRTLAFISQTLESILEQIDVLETERLAGEQYTEHLETVVSYFTSWWCGGCFPNNHHCKVCTYYDPDFWNCFLRIVLSILFMMHLITAGILYLVTSTPNLAENFNNYFILITVLSIVFLLMINYFMLCFVAGRCFCLSYLVLFAVVAAYTTLLAALTARLDTNAFLYGMLAVAAMNSALFFITLHPCFCFSQWELVLPLALGVGLMSFFSIHMYVSKFYAQTYPMRDLLLMLGVILIHAIILTFEIRRLLCSNCIDPCCLDYGLGAYLLYTMFLQIIFYSMYVLFSCIRRPFCCMYDYY